MTDLPDQITIDMDALTMRDVKEVETALGRKAGALFGGGISAMDADTLAAVVWVVVKKTQPDFTLEEALDVPFARITEAPASPLARSSKQRQRSASTIRTRQIK